jgi:ElaB/YqjD/DUF883 family membrane-anchored ribosome-binding protein
MSQTPITEQTFRHVVSLAGQHLPFAWRRLPEATTTNPTCAHFCLAQQKLGEFRWSAPALGVFFSEKARDFLREALEACAENTRVYLLAEDKETEAAKKFAAGLAPRLRPLLRTVSRQGPTAICTATQGIAWVLTRKGKSWRLTLGAEQSAACHERFLYTFWHEASAQHHLAGDAWVAQSGAAIEAPFNIPTPAEGVLSLLANDDRGLPDGDLAQLVSAELPTAGRVDTLLTERTTHTFAQLGDLLRQGVKILENSHDLPTAFISPTGEGMVVMAQAGSTYRLALSGEQTADLQAWIKSTDGWAFLQDIPKSTRADYLSATFQLEGRAETVPGQAYPGGSWEKDLGSFKATDFDDQKDGRLRKERSELPEPPPLAVEAVYTWNVKAPEADKTASKVKAYVEWDDTFKTINGIKKKLLTDFGELSKALESALEAHPSYKGNELGAAVLRCGAAKEELELLLPEQSGWKHGQAAAGYDPFKILRGWAEYYERTYRLPIDSKAHKKWGEDITSAEAAYGLAKTKVADITKLIQDCEDSLKVEGSDENAEPKPDKGAIESKLKGFKKDLEKAQRELDQKAKEKAVVAPAPGLPGDDRLAKRTDLTTPSHPLPVVGELRLTPKVEELTLCIQYQEEIAPAEKEAQRLTKAYGKPIRLAKG